MDAMFAVKAGFYESVSNNKQNKRNNVGTSRNTCLKITNYFNSLVYV